MAYNTFTLRIQDTTPNAVKPTSVLVQAWPLATIGGAFIKVIKDETDGTTISGHVKYTATPSQIAAGIVDVPLADPRDAANLNPSGYGWLVKVKTNYFETTTTFGPTELDAYVSGGVLLWERVVPVDPAAFVAVGNYATAIALATETTRATAAEATKVNSSTYTTGLAGKQALQQVATTVTVDGAAVVNKHNPVDATSAARTITLPTGQAEGTQVSVEKVDSSANTVSISGSIRGVGSSAIALAYLSESLMLRADSSGSWWPIAGHRTKVSLDTAYLAQDTPGFDLILLLGQSNMSGRGTAFDSRLDPSSDRIYQFGASGTYAGVISQAVEPLAMVDTPTGIGPGLGFARWYAPYLKGGRRVLLVTAAKGGVPFEGGSSPSGWTWKVSRNDVTNLYTAALTQTKAALAAAGPGSRVVAALWHQGESDGDNSTSGATYQTDLYALVDQLRTDLALPSLPFIIGQMVPDYLTSGTRTAINTVHAGIGAAKAPAAFAYGLPGANNGDGNHYNATGARFLARSMFDAFRALTTGGTISVPGTPTGLAAGTPGSTSVPLTWNAVTGAIGYAVQYRLSPSGSFTSFGVAGNSATVPALTASTAYDFKVTAYNAAGAGGTTSTVTATTAAPTAVFTDSFNRADNAASLGTADTGQTWVNIYGSWGIATNRAGLISATADAVLQAIAEANTTVSNATWQWTHAVLATGTGFSRFIFRGDGTANNFWAVQYRPSTGKYQLYKWVGGTATQVGTDMTVTPAAGDVISVVTAGTSITVKVNGVTAATATDSANQTGTYIGMGGSASAGGGLTGTQVARYDDLSVTP